MSWENTFSAPSLVLTSVQHISNPPLSPNCLLSVHATFQPCSEGTEEVREGMQFPFPVSPCFLFVSSTAPSFPLGFSVP